MAANSVFPKWLLDSKANITKSAEWNRFVGDLHDAIQQQLVESHVSDFTALSDEEKQLFLERAAHAIHGGESYQGLYHKVSLSLDQHINNDIAKSLLEDNPMNTKTELILDNAQEGSVALLRKWPEMKSKLHICLNQPLPETLRQVAWRLFLTNTQLRKLYLDKLASNPRSAISPLDLEISQKCEQLLTSQSTLQGLKGSLGAFYAMKATLSYHHARKKTKNSLSDIDYLLVVPFIYLASPGLSRSQPASGKVVALLVEEYLTFLERRPGYMIDSGSEDHNEEMKAFANAVADHLTNLSPELAQVISNAFVPSEEKIVATDSGKHSLLVDGVIELTRPMIRSLYVGFLNMRTLIFAWDQYIIGLDVPGYHSHFLSVFTAVLLMLLKDKLKVARTSAAMENVISTESPKLHCEQFQYEINRHFYRDLHKTLTKDEKAAMPVLDPTQADFLPWTHWHNEKVPGRTRHQDRKIVREEREAERQRLQQQQRDEEERMRAEEERTRRQEEDRVRQRYDKQQKKKTEEKLLLENFLDEERRRHMEQERKAKDEIDRLRLQIEELKRKKPERLSSVMSFSSHLSRYIVPPPPTRASGLSPIPQHMPSRITPAQTLSAKDQAREAILDFLGRIVWSVNKIAHGEGQEAEDLNEETKDLIRQHREDVKEAETQVFGHLLKPGDFDNLSPEEKEETSDRMMKVVRQRIEDRRRRQLQS